MSALHEGLSVTPSVRLVRPLGAGGMGTVWVAEHLALKTDVVVKFLAADLEGRDDAKARFSQEAAAAARVKSPHVVQMLDHGVTDDGVPFIVMERLEGHDLAAELKRGRLPPDEVAALVSQVAKALTKAHAMGIVHRDIKPENIFLCDGDGGERFVKLLDFGVAKAQTDSLTTGTTTGQILGTPFYMSPEQILGEVVDHRTDIWSLGVVAFEAIAGRKPFDGATVGALTLALHTTSPTLTGVDPKLPPALDGWFARICARKPDERFQSARDAAQALFRSLGAPDPAGTTTLRRLSIRPAMPSLHLDEPAVIGALLPLASPPTLGGEPLGGAGAPATDAALAAAGVLPSRRLRSMLPLAALALVGLAGGFGAVILLQDRPTASAPSGAALASGSLALPTPAPEVPPAPPASEEPVPSPSAAPKGPAAEAAEAAKTTTPNARPGGVAGAGTPAGSSPRPRTTSTRPRSAPPRPDYDDIK